MPCATSRSALRAVRGLAIAAGLLLPGAAVATSLAVEYHHARYGHYFVTASAHEIASLDAGPTSWARTGHAFPVLDLGAADSVAVCRFWSGQTFAPKSSHFYTSDAPECAKVKKNPVWQFEGEVFAVMPSLAEGTCAAGTIPVYRLYNEGRGNAPNHRYTVDPAVRAEMLGQGWTPEGDGPGVIGCVPGAAPFAIAAAGDIGQCFGQPASASAAARTARLVGPQDELVLTLGDHAYDDGTPQEFASCFDPTWGAFRNRIRPAPGNHDYYTEGAEGYFGYFGSQAGPDRRGYYSFDHGGWHFIALNTLADVSVGSPQHRWLLDDLARNAGTPCTIAYWHYPAFNSGGRYGSVMDMRPFFDALQAAGVEMVLSGHEHIYERFAPQRADGTRDPRHGVRQFVVGTGGHALNPLGPAVANSEFRSNQHWGVLRLTLGPGSYRWQFLSVDGGPALDAGSDTCHR